MRNYRFVAEIYDELFSWIDYEEWVNYLYTIAKRFKRKPRRVLDLGCGTGNSSIPWVGKGCTVVGVDLSEDMLARAREKAKKLGIPEKTLKFVRGDFRDFSVNGRFDLVVSLFDSLNYLSPPDLERCFRHVRNYMTDNALFLFDLNSYYMIKEKLWANSVVDRDRWFFASHGRFDPSEGAAYAHITIFVKREDGLYKRFDEVHKEWGYTVEMVEKALRNAGLAMLDAYEAWTFNPPKDTTERIQFVAEKAS